MADRNYHQNVPLQPRHAWSDFPDGSSVDPKYFILDNLHGIIYPKPGSQQQLRSVVNTQPQPPRTSRFATEDKLRFLGDHWKDQYYIRNMVHIRPDFQMRLDTSVIVDPGWIYSLKNCIDFGTFRWNIYQFMEANMGMYCKIVDLISSIRARDGLLQDIYFTEQQVFLDNWSSEYNKVISSLKGLRNLLACFMIMQMRLTQTIHELENYMKRYHSKESDWDLMDFSTTDDGAHSVREKIPQQQIPNRDLHPSGTSEFDQGHKNLYDQFQEKEKLVDVYRETNENLRRKVEAIDDLRAKSDSDLDISHQEIARLKQNVEALTTERDDILAANPHYRQNLQKTSGKSTDFEEKYNTLMKDNEKQRSEYIEMKKHLAIYCDKYDGAKKAMDEYKNTVISLKNQMKTKDWEIQNQYSTIKQQQKELEQLKKSKDELLTRLSKLAGTKLTHGNADITDLSDENRPVKIAEKFSELYDNEWTDALEELVSLISSEERAIEINLDIVSTAFKFCKDISTQYVEKLLHSLAHLPHVEIEPGVQEPDTETGATITQPIKKDIEDIRRTLAPQLISVAEQRFEMVAAKVIQSHLEGPQVLDRSVTYGSSSAQGAEGFGNSSRGTTSYPVSAHISNLQNSTQPSLQDLTSLLEKLPHTTYFAKKCANLCWLMQLRNPKVHMLYDPTKYKGKEFNGDMFRAYTKTGKQFGYLVWPVLLLHENGPTLGKGVAQPI